MMSTTKQNAVDVSATAPKVVSALWEDTDRSFNGVKFLFSGGGLSKRNLEKYISTYVRRSTSEDYGLYPVGSKAVLVLDLSLNSGLDSRLGVPKVPDVRNYLLTGALPEGGVGKLFTQTKASGVLYMGISQYPATEELLIRIELLKRIEELSRLGVSIIVVGGDVSSTFGRALFNSVVRGNDTLVVSSPNSIDMRSMYLNLIPNKGNVMPNLLVYGDVMQQQGRDFLKTVSDGLGVLIQKLDVVEK